MAKLYDAILAIVRPYFEASARQVSRAPEELVISSKSTAASGTRGVVNIVSPVDYDVGTVVVGVPVGNSVYYVVGKL